MHLLAEKDITEKSFIRLNDVFADVFNGLVFRGEQIVTPESLEVVDASSQYRTEDLSLHEMERDVLKVWKNYGINLVAFGVENQSEADKDMPFRIIAYDGSVYRSQLLKTEVKKVNGGHKQVLSKKRYPVITIVLYFNDKKGWDYPKNIKSCFNPPLPDNDVMHRLDELISDYEITVFDIGGMSLEEAAVFKSDFREVAEYFIKMRSGEKYVPSSRTITHVDEFLKLMSTLTGDRDYEKIIEKINNDNKEETTVCKVLQGAMNEGRREGYKIIIAIIDDYVKNNGVSVEEALIRLNVSEEEYNKYKSVMEEKVTGYSVLQGMKDEGIREGYKGEANSVITIIEDFAKNNGIPIENAMTMLNVSVEQYNKYKLALEEN